jgi:hypothetical protein
MTVYDCLLKFIVVTMKIIFKVKVKYEPNMMIGVAGDLPELGSWGVTKALYLEYKGSDEWEAETEV